jgi:hypothetical protein
MFQSWNLRRLLAVVIGLVAMVISIIGLLSLGYLRRNILYGLSIPILIGFIWLSCYKRKLAYALSLIALYVIVAISFIWLDRADALAVYPVLGVTALVLLSLGMWYRIQNRLGALVVSVVFCGGVLTLYILGVIDSANALIYAVGGIGALVGWFLFRRPQLVT